MANARNARRKRNRQTKDAERLVQGFARASVNDDPKQMPDYCACWGARNGEASYAVFPALCGHWFYIGGTAETGWHCDGLRKRPIRAIQCSKSTHGAECGPRCGKMVPMKASVRLRFRSHNDHSRCPVTCDGKPHPIGGTSHSLKYAADPTTN